MSEAPFLRATREALFQGFFERNPDPMTLSSYPDGRLVEANPAWCRLVGVPREAALGRTPGELGLWTRPEDREAIFRETVEAGISTGREVDMRLPGGEVRKMLVTATLLDLPGEQLVLLAGRDVTERHRTLEALRESEERFRIITGGLKDFILILDPEGTITYINQAPPPITPAQVLGRRFPASTIPESAAAGRKALEACLQTRRGVSYSAAGLRMDRTNGWFDIRLEPVLAGDELQAIVVLAFDRSDAREAEESERRAGKAESLVLMAGSIAHDFNNLFAAIQASLEVLAFQTQGQGDAASTLATAQEVLHRAVALSWKMNEFSGRAITRREVVDLGALLSAWASRQEPRRPGRTLSLDLRPVPRVHADPRRLRMVLDALLENAWEAMDEAGTPGQVTLKLFLDAGEDLAASGPPDAWPAPRPDTPLTACLEFANDGPCPGPDVLSRMFDPFFTTKFPGRGLGLASVLGLLQAHGAGVHVVPRGGEGLAFRLHFPVREYPSGTP